MKKITHGKTSKILMLDGETLFEQGDEGDLAYMIVHGTLDVFVDGKKVGSMRDGEVFGEMALLLNQRRSATIKSRQSSELVSISKDSLNELINSGSSKTKKVILELCEELTKRSEFQNVIYSRDEIEKIFRNRKCYCFKTNQADII